MKDTEGRKDGKSLQDEVKPYYAHKLKTLLVAVLATFTIVWLFKQQAGSGN